MPNVPTSTILETWHIEREDWTDFPFILICTPFIGAPLMWRFHTEEEALRGLQEVAKDHDRLGYLLALA
jgi:hypothetical protein